jgi:ABC-type lipoprotein export system ATPase subunit
MTIELSGLIPEPLRDHIDDSDVWNKDVSFSEGMIIELNARSARGKTTLVHMMYGLRDDYDGAIRFDGDDARALPEKEWARLRRELFSIVFQDLRLFEFLSGMENILVKSKLSGAGDEAQARRMADRLSISGALDKPVRELSWGEKQRVALIRALSQKFGFLFLDEPFSHLDKLNSNAACELILEQRKETGACIICTTLDPSSIFPFTHRIKV